jgi:hypothetical protein
MNLFLFSFSASSSSGGRPPARSDPAAGTNIRNAGQRHRQVQPHHLPHHLRQLPPDVLGHLPHHIRHHGGGPRLSRQVGLEQL